MVVQVSEAEVQEFKSKWPCSHLPDRAVAFQFNQGDGLVSIEFDGNAHYYEADPYALQALSDDAQNGKIGIQLGAA